MNKKKGRTFFAIFLFNLTIFIFVGSTVVMHTIVQRLEDPMVFVKVPTPRPVKPPTQAGGSGTKSNFDPSAIVQPPASAAQMIAAPNTTSFQTSTSVIPDIPTISDTDPPQGQSLAQNHSTQFSSELSLGNALFGVTDPNGTPMLAGYLYDLKQTSSRQKTNYTTREFHKELEHFVNHDWDQTVLDKFYKFSKPLFTPEIFIPNISASSGPKQFGAEKEIEPRMWLAYYKATVLPNMGGEYCFYGTCDDIIIVRVQGQTVLDGGLKNILDRKRTGFNFDYSPDSQTSRMAGTLKKGTPFHVSAGIPIKIDIIIGQELSSHFNAFLLLGQDGVTYPTGPKGMPKIPVFQVTPSTVPQNGLRLDAGPPIVWSALATQ